MLVFANGCLIEQSIWQKVFNLPQYRFLSLRLLLEKILVKRHRFLLYLEVCDLRLNFLSSYHLAFDQPQLVIDLVLDSLLCYGHLGRREIILLLISLLDFRFVGKCTYATALVIQKWRLDPYCTNTFSSMSFNHECIF